ncbi:alpha/beta hydrolase family protein [Pigmentiphaga litoralis]|uniref:Putative alpha/beta hydrolase n=1 Tax=Pigmentiphaga litoralis TaxID=516702 RepID=A0A7Y9IWI2_9BURK|nr:alpha/beta fold hydrolase [Pigmentiphaga litoralis]NYE22097.1 putative alpha/beta hydrolase [Pigmentiphaga litoralis]NYE84288.1 putative alpha/beta hydrolase [Pigmentiphaga litoralis]
MTPSSPFAPDAVERIVFPAADGYALGGYVWHGAGEPKRPRPVAIINAATSVRCRYYARFAYWLHQHGWDVVTFDYRGIGESRHGSLRKLDADWIDWGEHDVEGALRYVTERFPGQPIDVIGHSAGGFVVGLAASARQIQRIFTVGAQYAYWRDYSPQVRKAMFLRWHVAMPLLAWMLGYVPAKRLGWMEDTPKGVALDWGRMGPRFEHTVRRGRGRGLGPGRDTAQRNSAAEELASRFRQVTAPILAVGIDDDPFGTEPALDRLLDYYTRSERHHLRLAPAAINVPEIGHFAFFHEGFRDTLWPLALGWLRTGEASDTLLGTLKRRPADSGSIPHASP